MTDLQVPHRARLRRLADWREYIIYLGFVVIFLVFAVTLYDKGFLDPNNLLNIIRQTAMIAIMVGAMTFVLSAGEIDLSVGAVAGLASVATAMAYRRVRPSLGASCAASPPASSSAPSTAWLTTRVGIPSFLTTLAMMGIARGVAMWISGTAAIPILERAYAAIFGGGNLGPIPVLLIWMLLSRHRRPRRAAAHHLRPPGAGHRRQRDRGPL